MDFNTLSDSLVNNLYALSSLSKQKQLLNLGKGELCVLIALLKHGDQKPGELMKAVDTSSAHVAKILRNLEQKGEIIRVTDENDKRSSFVSITDKGRVHMQSIYDEVTDNTVELMKQLGEDDSLALLRITDKIMKIEGMKKEAAE